MQRAERRLVEPLEVDGAHRPAGRDQGLGDGALLGRHEIARRVACEIVGAGELGEVGRDAGAGCQRNSRGSR